MSLTRIGGTLLTAVVLVAAGWFGHAIANGPAPDVAAILKEADSVAGAKAAAKDSAQRKQTADTLQALQRAIDAARDTSRKATVKAAVAAVKLADAREDTDSALVELERAGADIEDLRGAFVRERTATWERDSVRSVAWHADSTELLRLREADSINLAQRAADSTRIAKLIDLNQRIARDLKRASRKGLDPAVTLSYSPGCDNLTVGGNVRIHGWLRGGVHVETKKCAP